jgi:hypothetical protein
MSQYSTLVRNGPRRRREDLAQRTPRNAGMSWGEPKVPARGGHVSIFNIGAQRTGEQKRRPRAEDAKERRDELGRAQGSSSRGSCLNIQHWRATDRGAEEKTSRRGRRGTQGRAGESPRFQLEGVISSTGVMSQYSTLARNGPGRRREDLAQRTPRNAGMSDTVESPTAPNKPIFLESHRLRASRGPCESSPRKGCQSF